MKLKILLSFFSWMIALPAWAQTADLHVTTVTAPSSVAVRDAVVVTITTTNNGPDTATGVVLSYPISPVFTVHSFSTTSGTCTEQNSTLTCDLNSLTISESVSLTLILIANAPASVADAATVSGNEIDDDLENNTALTPVSIEESSGNSGGCSLNLLQEDKKRRAGTGYDAFVLCTLLMTTIRLKLKATFYPL